MNERKGGALTLRLQKRRQSQLSVVTVYHNTNKGNEKTTQQMTAVPLTLPLLTSEQRLNLSSLQIHGFIIIWHTNYYICADCSLADLGYFWIMRCKIFSANPLFYSSKNFVDFITSHEKKCSDCQFFLLSIGNRGGAHLGSLVPGCCSRNQSNFSHKT